MTRKLVFSVDEYYHIYNRGVEQKVIFLDNADRYRFLKLIFLCNSHQSVDIGEIPEGEAFRHERGETLVDIGGYTLMDNHFHILIKEKSIGGISKFMGKVCTGYTMYFNKRYKHSGVLFQGVFQATHIDTDPLLEYIFSYIHLNPVKMIEPGWKENGIIDPAGAIRFLDSYTFSSYLDYKNEQPRELSPILNKGAFPEYFATKVEFADVLNSWLMFKELKIENN